MDTNRQESERILSSINKFLDKTQDTLDEALSLVEEYVEAPGTESADKRIATSTLKELQAIANQLEKISAKLPTPR